MPGKATYCKKCEFIRTGKDPDYCRRCVKENKLLLSPKIITKYVEITDPILFLEKKQIDYSKIAKEIAMQEKLALATAVHDPTMCNQAKAAMTILTWALLG